MIHNLRSDQLSPSALCVSIWEFLRAWRQEFQNLRLARSWRTDPQAASAKSARSNTSSGASWFLIIGASRFALSYPSRLSPPFGHPHRTAGKELRRHGASDPPRESASTSFDFRHPRCHWRGSIRQYRTVWVVEWPERI